MVKYWPQGIEKFFHGNKDCLGEHCVIHKPSNHRLRDADVIIRTDKGALAERVCYHGVGHPDPDSIAYFELMGEDALYMGIHGCDGCCVERRINHD